MRRHSHTIARFLLSLLLLLQLGGATSGVLVSHAPHADATSSQCQNHEGVLGHSSAMGSVGTPPMPDASLPNSNAGGCAAHCATALLAVTTWADVTAPPFVAALAPPV